MGEIIALGVFNLFVIINFLLTSSRVKGLSGGYGQGVWSESSIYMIDARESYSRAKVLVLLVIIIDAAMYCGISGQCQ